jgi:hypothetical protein
MNTLDGACFRPEKRCGVVLARSIVADVKREEEAASNRVDHGKYTNSSHSG